MLENSEPTVGGYYDVYLSGPILARPDKNFTAFHNAADRLRELGFEVFNPAELFNGDMTREYHEYLEKEIGVILNTNKAMVVLPGWEDGVGSKLEVAIACAIGLPVHKFHQKLGLGDVVYSKSAGREGVKSVFNVGRSQKAEESNTIELPHEEAARVVLGPRADYYDNPLDNFTRAGLMWSGVLYSKLQPGALVSAEDVALCMNTVKIARESFRHKRDNIVDGHGYWMTLEMLIEERQKREQAALEQAEEDENERNN